MKMIKCSYCGNTNAHAYKGSCPKCPEKTTEQPKVTNVIRVRLTPRRMISRNFVRDLPS
jgi:NMD protein affecting ribosome stability and mRNA decay